MINQSWTNAYWKWSNFSCGFFYMWLKMTRNNESLTPWWNLFVAPTWLTEYAPRVFLNWTLTMILYRLFLLNATLRDVYHLSHSYIQIYFKRLFSFKLHFLLFFFIFLINFLYVFIFFIIIFILFFIYLFVVYYICILLYFY